MAITVNKKEVNGKQITIYKRSLKGKEDGDDAITMAIRIIRTKYKMEGCTPKQMPKNWIYQTDCKNLKNLILNFNCYTVTLSEEIQLDNPKIHYAGGGYTFKAYSIETGLSDMWKTPETTLIIVPYKSSIACGTARFTSCKEFDYKRYHEEIMKLIPKDVFAAP